jgi:hypothetical protein
MEIYNSKASGIFFIVMGGVLLCLSFLAPTVGVFTFVIGCFNMWTGISYLTRPCFVVTDTSLTINNPMGGTIKSYALQSLKDIELHKNALYLNQNGRLTRLGISVSMLEKSDWQAFSRKITIPA